MKQNILLIIFVFASFALVASSIKFSVRTKGGKYHAKVKPSIDKRRGRIIKCCGYTKCDPALSGTRTNQDPNRPKTSRNNNTAAGTGNRNSKEGAAIGNTGTTLFSNKDGSSGGAPGSQGGASVGNGGSVSGSGGSPSGAASAGAGGAPGTSGSSGSSEGDEAGGVDGAASGGSKDAAAVQSAGDGSSGPLGGVGTGTGASGAGTSGTGTSNTGISDAGASGTGASGTGTSGSGTSGSGMSGTGTSGSGTSGYGTSGYGTSGSRTSDSGTSGNGTSGSGMSGNGTSGSGTSSTGGTSANSISDGSSAGGAKNSTSGGASNSTISGSGTSGNTSSGNATSTGNSTASGGNGTASANSTSNANGTVSGNATASGSNSSTASNSTATSNSTTAVNGTTTKPCVKPTCDPSMFARRRRRRGAGASGATGATTAPVGADGSFSRACNSTFFFGSNPVSWSESYAACQKFGMVSIGIGKPEKQKCVSDAANSNPKSANKSFWTSTHKKNATCPKTYAMCDVNEIAGPNITELLTWASDMAGTDSETCVFLALMAGSPNGLANAFCNRKLNIMCEPKCKKPDCPTSCNKDDNLFDNGALKNANLGLWLTVDGSKTKYLFTTEKGDWQKGWDFCCKIGMKMAGFETPEKSKELMVALKGKILPSVEYWISLTQINCVGTWSFCSSETILENSIVWTAGQPDNWMGKENHGAMKINWGKTVLEISDRDIGSHVIPYLCEQPV